MSLITLISKKKSGIEWDLLHQQLKPFQAAEIEVYPIPKELGFTEDALGIAVSSRAIQNSSMKDNLYNLVSLLLDENFEVIDLYSGLPVDRISVSKLLRNNP